MGWALGLAAASSAVGRAGDSSEFQVVTVHPGDTLWGIANTYLKDPQRWNELLSYNKKLSADPASALPGMTLRIPIKLVKPALRAAVLSYIETDVFYRARGTQTWTQAVLRMPLYPDDALKTGAMSRARIKFPVGAVLNMDSDSMVVIKPQSGSDDADLKLVRGKLRALHISLKAADAEIAPKTNDTIYEATIRNDRSAKIEVYSGDIGVKANGRSVDVGRGFSAEVPEGRTPAAPEKMVEADVRADKAAAVRKANEKPGPSSATTNLGHFDVDLRSLPIGSTLAGFRVQASRGMEFKEVDFDRVFGADEEISFRETGLPAGTYWWRAAPVDLLGASGKFSEPKKKRLE